ncbi:MAG: hypothetical protein LBQ32_00970 [Burkholderiaceae bacterium]|nr:hypothetical protein [Burkholderiaceae bacterium]
MTLPHVIKRSLSDHSVREIIDTKSRINSELRAALYLFEGKKFILSAISVIVEYGEPAVFDVNVEDELLGLTICDKLLEYSPENTRDLSKYKLDDWAVYKASGAKTSKYFERESVYVSVNTLNSSIQIEASPRISNAPELKALCSISNGLSHTAIGEAIRKAIRASGVLRDAGVL